MDNLLQDLMEELASAVNQTVAESGRVAEVIGAMERNGYDVVLALETTIGLSVRNQPVEVGSSAGELPLEPAFKSSGTVNFTPQDERFLQLLKIAC
jgi:hypothetical protein